MYIFKTYFKIEKSDEDIDFQLFIGTSNMPGRIFLNGKLIGRIGSYKENYTSQIHTSKSVYLPNETLLFGNDTINEICLQIFPNN